MSLAASALFFALFTLVRGRGILGSSVTQSGRGCYASARHKAATEYLQVKTL